MENQAKHLLQKAPIKPEAQAHFIRAEDFSHSRWSLFMKFEWHPFCKKLDPKPITRKAVQNTGNTKLLAAVINF